MNYLNDTDLKYEIILSKGRGIVSDKLYNMMILISQNQIYKKDYNNHQLLKECRANGLFMMIWKVFNFNSKKFDKALPYLSEVFKRGSADAYNNWHGINRVYPQMKFLSLSSKKDGSLIYGI